MAETNFTRKDPWEIARKSRGEGRDTRPYTALSVHDKATILFVFSEKKKKKLKKAVYSSS